MGKGMEFKHVQNHLFDKVAKFWEDCSSRFSLLTLLISSFLVAKQPRGLCGGLGSIELRRMR